MEKKYCKSKKHYDHSDQLLENFFLVIEKNLFEITQTSYSNSERSEQFMKQNAFLTYSWRFLRSNDSNWKK